MNRLEAEKLARKAYCEQCPDKRTVINLAAPPDRGYTVVCPTELLDRLAGLDTTHPLSVAPSQFAKYLERWRQGERLFSLEGEVFGKALRKMQRGDPVKWDYEATPEQGVIRIGHEWWPGLIGREIETMTQALVTKDNIAGKVALTRFVDRNPSKEVIKLLMGMAVTYDLDPALEEITIYESKPMITERGWVRKATGSGVYNGESDARILSAEEKVAMGKDSPTVIGVGIRQYRKGVDHAPEFYGFADAANPYRNNPVETKFTYEMACKRARVKGISHIYRDKLPTIFFSGVSTFEDDTEDDRLVDERTGEILEGTAHEVPPAEETAQEAPTDTTTLFSDIIFENIEDDIEYQQIVDVITLFKDVRDINGHKAAIEARNMLTDLTAKQEGWLATERKAAEDRLKQPQRR